jgi:glyoxylase-like metal-dependent hydrolase (beta-lactamase superfamily II)
VIFTQFVDEDLGCASYLVGDENAGTAVVVDPAFAIEQYLDESERRDVRIVRTVETHTHADHVSGHGRLALEHGIPVSIHAAAGAEYPHDAFEDGAEIEVGHVVLRCIHTPGHRPEHCAIAVVDRSRGDEPWLVLTGDALLVGDAGRPDLHAHGEQTVQEMAGELYRSLTERLLALPDHILVYPGHYSGSVCGRGLSANAASTIGFERRHNPALQFSSEAEFVRALVLDLPPPPPQQAEIMATNRSGHTLTAPH